MCQQQKFESESVDVLHSNFHLDSHWWQTSNPEQLSVCMSRVQLHFCTTMPYDTVNAFTPWAARHTWLPTKLPPKVVVFFVISFQCFHSEVSADVGGRAAVCQHESEGAQGV